MTKTQPIGARNAPHMTEEIRWAVTPDEKRALLIRAATEGVKVSDLLRDAMGLPRAQRGKRKREAA